MKKLLLVTLLILITFFGYGQETNIIGGNNTTIEQNPWQISIRRLADHWCGGSILTPEWILTAAHCLDGVPINELQVAAGITNRNDNLNGQYRNIAQVIIHPDYNAATSNNDVALIRLSVPLNFNNRVLPIQLTNNLSHFNTGQTTRVTGWGNTLDGPNPSLSNVLQELEMPIISNTQANNMNTGSTLVNNNMIALYEPNSGVSRGDSGGPLSMTNNGIRYLIGSSSWGEFPKDEKPTIYTKLFNYRNWISGHVPLPEVTGEDLICSGNTFTYNLENPPSNITWTTSDNLDIVGSTSTSVTVEPKYSSGSTGFITANLNWGDQINKNIQINNPRLTENDVSVRDSYFNSLSGDGTMTSPYLICEGQEYVISMYSPKVNFIDYSTFPSGWTSYSYGVYEIAFTANNITPSATYSVLVDYIGACGSALHTIYFAKETYCTGGMYVAWPNPTIDNLHVDYKNSNNHATTTTISSNLKYNYEIYDFQAKRVLNGKLNRQKNSINVSDLKKGIYILKIYVEGDVETHKIIIE